MIKRLLTLSAAAALVTSLSSCAAVAGLVTSVLRLPGSVIGAVTESETEPASPYERAPGVVPEVQALDQEEVSIVVTPIAK